MEQRSIGKAIASLVLGIISVSLSLVCTIFFFFSYTLASAIGIVSIICGVIAIVLGAQARPGHRASAGLICGIIGTSLTGCVMLCSYLLLFIMK